ncbi:hypothetical protein AAH016_03275 [Phocaeicola dorei]|uniref:hypothetical protein n=1 Tax=Phocaeicola TaxID=909656 RepID=UPI0026E0C694|nr:MULTISPECIES: hypothetical protein [Phocaeicola]MDO5880044.1 hypothetical protein [Phocaeicola vulgatus]MDO6368732.1 hypothetical protein [Phocaeicola vulgatus]MDQ8008235.1 hypothetical protein [Phocaeicola sp. GP0067]
MRQNSFRAAKNTACYVQSEHKNLTVPGQIRVSDRRQGRRLQSGLLDDTKLREWKRVVEFASVPLRTTLMPVDATEL